MSEAIGTFLGVWIFCALVKVFVFNPISYLLSEDTNMGNDIEEGNQNTPLKPSRSSEKYQINDEFGF